MNPYTFIDKLKSKKHLLLVYDDPTFAKMIQFRFINNGLTKDEHCIFLTHGKPKDAEEEMKKFGINVEHFKKRKILHIYPIPNPVEHYHSISEGADDILKLAISDSEPPYRVVARLVPNVETEEAMAIQGYFEQKFHNTTFDNFNGSVLCSYDFSEIKSNNNWQQWLNHLYDCHNASIVPDKSGQYLVTNFNNGH